MKTLLLASLLSLTTFCSNAQIDTSVIMSQPEIITIDGKDTFGNIAVTFSGTFVNQRLQINEEQTGKPLMVISLPAKSGKTPDVGEYKVIAQTNFKVKKGSFQTKIDFVQGLKSVDDGGTLHIFFKGDLYWFYGKDIKVLDKTTNQIKLINIKQGMIIQ